MTWRSVRLSAMETHQRHAPFTQLTKRAALNVRRAADIESSGVVSFDLSGPHVLGKDQSLYFLVGAFMSDKKTLPYVTTQASKKSAETLQNMQSICRIIMQLRAEFEDPVAVIRVHSDNGGEFIAGKVVEALHYDLEDMYSGKSRH